MERKRLRILEDSNLSVNQQKDTGRKDCCCSNLKMYTLQETGNLRRQTGRWCRRMMGNREFKRATCLAKCLCLRTSSTAESYQCEPQTPKRRSRHGWQKANLAAVRLGAPAPRYCTWLWSLEALCTGVVACVQAPSDLGEGAGPAGIPECREELAVPGSRLTCT